MYVYASARPTSIGALSALRFSGRFIVMITTAPSRSTTQFSVEAGSVSGMAAQATEQGHEVVEGAHAHAVEVGVVVEWIDEHRMDPGRARTDDVGRRCVADVQRVLGCHAHGVERETEDRGVGLVDADDARVDDGGE